MVPVQQLTSLALFALKNTPLSKNGINVTSRIDADVIDGSSCLNGWILLDRPADEVAFALLFSGNALFVMKASQAEDDFQPVADESIELACADRSYIEQVYRDMIIQLEKHGINNEDRRVSYEVLTHDIEAVLDKGYYCKHREAAGKYSFQLGSGGEFSIAGELTCCSQKSSLVELADFIEPLASETGDGTKIISSYLESVDKQFTVSDDIEKKHKITFDRLYSIAKEHGHVEENPFIWNDVSNRLHIVNVSNPQAKVLCLKTDNYGMVWCLNGDDLYTYRHQTGESWRCGEGLDRLINKGISYDALRKDALSYVSTNCNSLHDKNWLSMEKIVNDINSSTFELWSLKNREMDDRGFETMVVAGHDLESFQGALCSMYGVLPAVENPLGIDFTTPDYLVNMIASKGGNSALCNRASVLAFWLVTPVGVKWIEGSAINVRETHEVHDYPKADFQGDGLVSLNVWINAHVCGRLEDIPDNITSEWWGACWEVLGCLLETYMSELNPSEVDYSGLGLDDEVVARLKAFKQDRKHNEWRLKEFKKTLRKIVRLLSARAEQLGKRCPEAFLEHLKAIRKEYPDFKASGFDVKVRKLANI